MISFREYINRSNRKTSRSRMYEARETVQPKTKDELKKIIEDTIKEQGNNCDLNFIDTSKITDMSKLLCNSKFNGDISKWDVSKVKDMEGMFFNSKFNGNISKWNVSNVENMSWMFVGSNFNSDISKWDVRNVKDHDNMFTDCSLEDMEEFQPKFKD